jgi:two-component system phosphate regulon sensor histidine kinase PhoR
VLQWIYDHQFCTVEMKNSAIWKVLVSGALAVGCIFIFQAYWLVKSYSLAERTFDEKVRIGLIKTAEQISRLTNVQLPSQNLVSQLSQDYYVVNIKDAIDPVNLEFFLVTEFQAVALNTDFEYGIYNCESDEMVYGNYIDSFTGTTSVDGDFIFSRSVLYLCIL